MLQLAFDLGTFFSNLTSKASDWAGYFVMFLGLVLMVIAVVQIVKGFASHGRGQTNWLMTLAMLLVGGFLFVKGFTGVQTFAEIGSETIQSLGS